jgi:hypothetical protein
MHPQFGEFDYRADDRCTTSCLSNNDNRTTSNYYAPVFLTTIVSTDLALSIFVSSITLAESRPFRRLCFSSSLAADWNAEREEKLIRYLVNCISAQMCIRFYPLGKINIS